MIYLCGVRELISKRDIKIRLLLLIGIAYSVAASSLKSLAPPTTDSNTHTDESESQAGDARMAPGNLAQSLGDIAQ